MLPSQPILISLIIIICLHSLQCNLVVVDKNISIEDEHIDQENETKSGYIRLMITFYSFPLVTNLSGNFVMLEVYYFTD